MKRLDSNDLNVDKDCECNNRTQYLVKQGDMKDLGGTSRSSSIIECQALFEADNNRLLYTNQSTNNKNDANEDGPIPIRRINKNNSRKKGRTAKEEREKVKASIDRYC